MIDWQTTDCPRCGGGGWLLIKTDLDDGLLCPLCRGSGKLAEEINRRNLVNIGTVIQFIFSNWSLIGGALMAAFAVFQSGGNLQAALLALIAFLFGHAGGGMAATGKINAHYLRRPESVYHT